ncbi:hypothetical protein D7B24_004162 [Verticillium nonalfalfae]|uniref:Uncharacterized protein n=1 Tax=Verticillium nonalfalfae TaxID=1051616 RepID=A0A3M9YGV3_9PEZI|nr:uncharacterized protein D7B24_004162 [Verticillium nonalfalfae]RNJ58798.1 hypothetical protein D7B24_004162 [Verticillium nonalfalfae]
MERPKRPPPLALAPPKKQDKSVYRQTMSITPPAPKPHPVPQQQPRAPSRHASRHRSHRASPSTSWIHLASTILHIHLCAVLIAALATFLHDQPAAATTQIGHNVIAALIFLIFDTLLSLLSILRPAHAVTLLVRSGIATCLLAVFIAFAAHVPGPRVFTPGYHLWGTVFETGDGLVAGAWAGSTKQEFNTGGTMKEVVVSTGAGPHVEEHNLE